MHIVGCGDLHATVLRFVSVVIANHFRQVNLGSDSGMQITTADDMQEPSGFEDVDLSEIQNED